MDSLIETSMRATDAGAFRAMSQGRRALRWVSLVSAAQHANDGGT